MCRADTSLMTFHWEVGRREPMLKLESPEHIHMCRLGGSDAQGGIASGKRHRKGKNPSVISDRIVDTKRCVVKKCLDFLQ